MSLSQPQTMSNPLSSSSTSSVWSISYTKLQFLTKIRRFLKLKAPRKTHFPISTHDHHQETPTKTLIEKETEKTPKQSVDEDEDFESVDLQKTVKGLHFGSWEDKEAAAKEIERVAKEDVKMRKFIAELGVVPVLVSMVGSDVVLRRRAALRALIQLADGTYTNKALIIESEICLKLPQNPNLLDETTKHDFVELLLSLSSLAKTQFPITLSEILPFLTTILDSNSTTKTKNSCLSILHNLSTVLENTGPLISNGSIQILLGLILVKESSEKALSTLSQLVVTLMGKKAIETSSNLPEDLIEVLSWDDKPKCQELSAYILMILAHQSFAQREKMTKAGIVPVLLNVVLLGSPLAQKRGVKLLQWFKDERQSRMDPHSGPQSGLVDILGSPINDRGAQRGKRMMKNLVKQSLYRNLEVISRRANGVAAAESSKIKSLIVSTSSKSLPY